MTDSLLSRLQALTEPSREIDAEIALANGWYIGKTTNDGVWFNPDGQIHDEPPHYTKSIDAVVILVPPELTWSCGFDDPFYQAAPEPFARVANRKFVPQAWYGKAATPAIALLIAITKAKEET